MRTFTIQISCALLVGLSLSIQAYGLPLSGFRNGKSSDHGQTDSGDVTNISVIGADDRGLLSEKAKKLNLTIE